MVYINNSKTLAFGHISKNIDTILKKRKRKDFHEITKFYKGDVIFIINHDGNNISYDINLWHEAESVFKLARKKNLGWSWQYFTDGKILLIEGECMWCLLPPLNDGFHFKQEEEKFNERILNGLDFFKIKITNQLDWSVINSNEFEDLCYDLLRKM